MMSSMASVVAEDNMSAPKPFNIVCFKLFTIYMSMTVSHHQTKY